MPAAQYPDISDRAVVSYILQDLDGAAANSWVSTVANEFSSNQASETYAGLGNVPAMREWLGPKLLKSLADYAITITNKDWESTLAVKRKDLTRDKTGQLRVRTGELGLRATEHTTKILSELLDTGEDGDLGLAYDGQFFFDTDHVVNNSGTINNDITYDVTTTTAPTPAEMASAIQAAIQALYGFKDDQGEPTNHNAKSFVVMVPTVFWGVTTVAVRNEMLVTNTSGNVSQSPLHNIGLNISVIANPRLTWTTKFAVFVADGPRKAFIVQTEDGPRVEVLTEGSDHAFHNAEHLFSVIKSGNVGYGDFLKAILVTLV